MTKSDEQYAAGFAAAQRGEFAAALPLLRSAVASDPRHVEAHYALGYCAAALGDFPDALHHYERAIALNPAHVQAHNNQGLILKASGRLKEAFDSFGRALAAAPDFAEALYNHAVVALELGHYAQALSDYDRFLTLASQHPGALTGKAITLLRLKRFGEARPVYDALIAGDDTNAEAYCERGLVHRQLKSPAAALADFDAAIARKPDFVRALRSRAELLMFLKRGTEAVADFDKAVRLDPENAALRAQRLYTKISICDWTDFTRDLADLERTLAEGLATVPASETLDVIASPALQLEAATRWAAGVARETDHDAPGIKKNSAEKIRLGYLSGDYRNHAVPFLIAALIEHHDRARFDVIGYAIGEGDDGAMRRRLEKAFDRFLDLEQVPDQDVAQCIAGDGIDILIDLSGYTRFGRPGILALRPAPVQVNYLGYPGTMGAAFMDYIIADREIIPDDQQQFYTEKVVTLPDCYQPNDDQRAIAATKQSRAACGLPEKAFVFCSFNRPSKIAPAVFAVWMDVLRAVPNSVLWLLEINADAASNLRRAAQAHRVDPARLVFAPFVGSPENLARLRNADLILDTLPYNAHTTLSDALWAGIPAVTCRGKTFAGRVGASLLRAAGLSELITDSLSDYAALALALARDPDRLDALFAKLENPARLPLFESVRYTRNIEKAYSRMAELQRTGRRPEAFSI